MTHHIASPSPSTPPTSSCLTTPVESQVTLRSAGDLVEALPYLMGFRPDDSVVILALHASGRFGGRLRFDIPERDEWSAAAKRLADYLVTESERRIGRPEGAIVFLCSDPQSGEEAYTIMERLRPLAQHLRTACGAMDVPVQEALCVSGGRWWSYTCPTPECCPESGVPVARSGTSVVAAAAAFAGMPPPGGIRELAERFAPLAGETVASQEQALDEAAANLFRRILDPVGAEEVRQRTAALLTEVLARFSGPSDIDAEEEREGTRERDRELTAQREAKRDQRDDELLTDAQAAHLILGLQDRAARDHAARWMEAPSAAPALRLWRALARRCVGAYQDHAAPPLALAGWVAWLSGDEAEARVAFQRALAAESSYVFARLMHEACNQGVDPESLRECLRGEWKCREVER